jgi:hypothetical protein
MSRPKDCGVARFFGEGREPSRQPPRQWMEPENGAVEEREPLDQRIAPAQVFLLVRQHGVEMSG